MNPAMLFLTQLLPLLAFIVVDAFVTDVRISILCAVLFALGQLAFTWLKSRRVDWFIILDVALIVALGGISIAFENELFFKVKPAIVDGVAIVFFVALLVAPSRFLLGYLGRMMPGRALGPEAVGTMKAMLGLLGAGTALHVALVLYTAFHSSKEVWAFVSGPGLYLVLFPPTLIFGLVQRARRRAGQGPASKQETGET